MSATVTDPYSQDVYNASHDPNSEAYSTGYPLGRMARALGMTWRELGYYLCPGYYWESDEPIIGPHYDICEELAAEQGVTIPALDPLPSWAIGMR